MIQLICTDKGQHPPRDIVTMVDRSGRPPFWEDADGNRHRVDPTHATARWHVLFHEAWIRPRRKAFWLPVLPLHLESADRAGHRVGPIELIEADVLVFRCPTCSRRPRWRREPLDDLCDRASAERLSPLDLSLLE